MKNREQGGRVKGVPNGVQIWGEHTSVRIPKEIVPDVKEFVSNWKQKKLIEIQKAVDTVIIINK